MCLHNGWKVVSRIAQIFISSFSLLLDPTSEGFQGLLPSRMEREKRYSGHCVMVRAREGAQTMSKDLDGYLTDPRLALMIDRKHRGDIAPDVRAMFLYATDRIGCDKWHWLQYYFAHLPPHETALEIAFVAANIEICMPGVGQGFIDDIASLAGKEKYQPHYEQILQRFAEMLVIERILGAGWPADAAFAYEPKGRSGKRPEMSVTVGEDRYLFEVKAPALLEHVRARSRPNTQIPARGVFHPDMFKHFAEGGPVLRPRDNPVKDFLASADVKFADFDHVSGCNILVIVWDDFIYEPISALVHPQNGLLTQASFHRDEMDEAITFPNVDAVVAIRHLTYFYNALAERPLPDRAGAFDFGGANDLPNVLFPTPWGRPVPGFVAEGLRALDYRSSILENVADYQPKDLVWWVSPGASA